MDGQNSNIIVRHLLESRDHFAVFINTHGIKMTVGTLHNKLANGQ